MLRLASKFLVYHGTSSGRDGKVLQSIMDRGLSYDPKQIAWGSGKPNKDFKDYLAQQTVKTLGGVYVAKDPMLSLEYAKHSQQFRGGDAVLLVMAVDTARVKATLDEDPLFKMANQFLNKYIGVPLGVEAFEAVRQNKINWTDATQAWITQFSKDFGHTISKKSYQHAFPFLAKALRIGYYTSNLYDHKDAIEEYLGRPLTRPMVAGMVAKQREAWKQALDALPELKEPSKSGDPELSENHNLRVLQPIGYEGPVRIIAVLTWNESDNYAVDGVVEYSTGEAGAALTKLFTMIGAGAESVQWTDTKGKVLVRRAPAAKAASTRTAADPAPAEDAFQDVEDRKKKEHKEEEPSKDTSWEDQAFVAKLTKRAQQQLQDAGIRAELLHDDAHKPQVETTGIDLVFRLLRPELKGALLTFSWSRSKGLREWLKNLPGSGSDQLSLYFCAASYIAQGKQIPGFLKSIGTIQSSNMEAGTDEELQIYRLIPDKPSTNPKTQQERDEKAEQAVKDRILKLFDQLQSSNPQLTATANPAKVLDAAKNAFESNNITKQQFDELQKYVKTVGAEGWKKLMQAGEESSVDTSYKNVALEDAVAAQVTKLTDGRYKGKAQVGYRSSEGKNHVIAVLNAPFPFHFAFKLEAGGRLTLEGAGAKICQNDYSVGASEAVDLMWAVLSLGTAAKQAAQVPKEIRDRGKERQELSDEDAKAMRQLQRELSGEDPDEPDRGYQEDFSSKLYPITFKSLVALSGKTVDQALIQRANDLGNQDNVNRATILQLFTDYFSALGIKVDENDVLTLLDAVESGKDPRKVPASAVTVLKRLLGIKKKKAK